jgi:hypothetical protein
LLHTESPPKKAGEWKVAPMNSLVSDLILVGVIVAVIVVQLKGTTIGARWLLIIPAVLVILGAVNLNGTKGVQDTDIAYIAASSAIAAVIGIVQGCVMRLEQRKGALWGQMPLWGLWLWGALLVSRLAVHVVADARSATAAASLGAIILTLGINRAAQAVAMAIRATKKGIPLSFDGVGGGLLSGFLGKAAGSAEGSYGSLASSDPWSRRSPDMTCYNSSCDGSQVPSMANGRPRPDSAQSRRGW